MEENVHSPSQLSFQYSPYKAAFWLDRSHCLLRIYKIVHSRRSGNESFRCRIFFFHSVSVRYIWERSGVKYLAAWGICKFSLRISLNFSTPPIHDQNRIMKYERRFNSFYSTCNTFWGGDRSIPFSWEVCFDPFTLTFSECSLVVAWAGEYLGNGRILEKCWTHTKGGTHIVFPHMWNYLVTPQLLPLAQSVDMGIFGTAWYFFTSAWTQHPPSQSYNSPFGTFMLDDKAPSCALIRICFAFKFGLIRNIMGLLIPTTYLVPFQV